jgi:hypothetical protein
VGSRTASWLARSTNPPAISWSPSTRRHAWVPKSRSCWMPVGPRRGRTCRVTPGGHAAAAVDDTTGQRYGRADVSVKLAGTDRGHGSTCHRPRWAARHRGDTPERGVHRPELMAAGCGQPLVGGPPASLVSRGSPGTSPPVVPRESTPHPARPGAYRDNVCTQVVDDDVDRPVPAPQAGPGRRRARRRRRGWAGPRAGWSGRRSRRSRAVPFRVRRGARSGPRHGEPSACPRRGRTVGAAPLSCHVQSSRPGEPL